MQVLEQAPLDIQVQLDHSEGKIERATRNAFYDVGLELRHIKDSRLYRQGYATFEEYCQARWEWSTDRVRQLIDAATAVEQMPTIVGILPTRESHVRPLLKLDKPALRTEVWQRVVASQQPITAKMIEAEVERKIAELNREWFTLEDWAKLTPEDRQRIIRQPYAATPTFNETNDNIEWAGFSWNPITGCLHDCQYCYARDIAHRFYAQGFEPAFLPSRLGAPQHTRLPAAAATDIGKRNVFVCSMADLFGKWVPQDWIDAVLDTVRLAPQWNFLFLTKNPRRLAEIEWPDNAWVGTTVDCQARVAAAEEAFRNVKARVRFLSCEPLRESVKFSDLSMFDWMIIGGQSKSSGEPEMLPDWNWLERLQWQAREYGLKVYHKPNLGNQVRAREYPEG